MTSLDRYQKFQALIFQQQEAQARVLKQNAIEAFMQFAEANGFRADDVLKMLNRGMSVQQVFEVIKAKE